MRLYDVLKYETVVRVHAGLDQLGGLGQDVPWEVPDALQAWQVRNGALFASAEPAC